MLVGETPLTTPEIGGQIVIAPVYVLLKILKISALIVQHGAAFMELAVATPTPTDGNKNGTGFVLLVWPRAGALMPIQTRIETD